MKRSIALTLTAALFSFALPSFGANVPDEQFAVTKATTDDRYTGINLDDTQSNRHRFSALLAYTSDGNIDGQSLITGQWICKTYGAGDCTKEKLFIYYNQLGYCTSKLTSDCVVGVSAKDSQGKEYQGTFVEDYAADSPYAFDGDDSVNLPTSGTSFIVDFPSIPHPGGTKYFVTANLLGKKTFGADQKFEVQSMNTAIFAVTKIDGKWSRGKPDLDSVPKATRVGGFIAKQGGWSMDSEQNRSNCIQSDEKTCLIGWPLPLDVDFSVALKLHTNINGWLHARIKDVNAEINRASDGDQLIKVSGKPTIVPGLFAWFKKDAMPPSLTSFYSGNQFVNLSGSGFPSAISKNPWGSDGAPYSILKENFGYDEGSFKEVLAWIDAVSDKATIAPSSWTFKSINSDGQYAACMKDKTTLSGIVSANATMYVASPPSFNKAEGTLDYKVVAPHYLPNGDEFKGVYNLLIKSDVARCLYGYTNAPVSATISILNSSGQTQVATTTFGERNGWLALSANGFTFSSPTLKVKLTQQQAVENTSPAPVVAKPAAKKITCVKGKVKKTVTGTKCPTGYKKAA